VRAGKDGELVLRVAVMRADPLQDVAGAAQQLLCEVRGYLVPQPVHLHLLGTASICQSLQPTHCA